MNYGIPAEGVMSSASILPTPAYDIYCPAQDQSHDKTPDRLNYFKESCTDRLTGSLCSFRDCPVRNTGAAGKVPIYDYIFFGCGVQQTPGNRWNIFDQSHNRIGIERSINKCKNFILENVEVTA